MAIVPRYFVEGARDSVAVDHGDWCRREDVEMFEKAYRELSEALERACRHDDPDNSGRCIKCRVTLDFDGPLHLVGEKVDWQAWAKEQDWPGSSDGD